MMREKFVKTNFHGRSLVVIDQANRIISEYLSQGLRLTLRQLYYQFVARDLVPNSQRSYSRIGDLMSRARLAGLVDWDAIEDRTRSLRGVQHSTSPAQMIRSNARLYAIDMWENQSIRIEVWIEKDALTGVIESTCQKHDVDFFSCRGYVSQSEIYDAGVRLREYALQGFEPVVIHLGDHDPSGIDMTRDNQDRLNMFSQFGATVLRIALNMDQVEEYKPPPNPAKVTDSRFDKYVEKHGRSSWELDALDPAILQNLIDSTIESYKDPDAWLEAEARLQSDKRKLDAVIRKLDKWGEDE